MADPIREALERLLAVIKPKYTDPDEIVAVVRAMAAAHTALAAEPPAPAPAADPLPGFAATLIASQRPMDPDVAAALTPEARWEMYDGAPAPAADGERDHVPDAGNMVAADGEAEELATLLAIGSSCAAGAKLSPEQCRRAAALLRQPAPAPAPAADGEREELAQWLERIGDDYDDLYRPPSALIRPKLARAAALLRQPGPAPVPVPVAERPWERPGWCDAEGFLWLWDSDRRWVHQTGTAGACNTWTGSFALPHWAIAIPQPPPTNTTHPTPTEPPNG